MTLKKGSKIDRGYATVTDDEGDNYRDIAEIMTNMGYPMNHSSARNYVLRVMRLFVEAYSEKMGLDLSEQEINEVAKSPQFQLTLAEKLQILESMRRESLRTN
jgi:hypothetical protein